MSGASPISLRHWHMSRTVFALHIGAIALCCLGFATTNAAGPWLGAVALLLVLPISQSMRLKDAGHSPFWPLPFLAVLAYAGWQLMGALAAVSGAPGGGADPVPSPYVTLENVLIYGTPIALALLTAYCAFAPRHPLSPQDEVPQ